MARHHSIFHFWNTVCSCRLPATAARWPTKQPTTQHNPTTQRRNDAQARNGGVSLLARGRRWPHHTEWTPRLAAVIRDCVVRVLVLVPNLLMVVCWWLWMRRSNYMRPRRNEVGRMCSLSFGLVASILSGAYAAVGGDWHGTHFLCVDEMCCLIFVHIYEL